MPKRVATMKDLNELSEAFADAIRITNEKAQETRRLVAAVDENLSTRLATVEKEVLGGKKPDTPKSREDTSSLEDFAEWICMVYFVTSPEDSTKIDRQEASWDEVDMTPQELIQQYRAFGG